jgi:hypothetical protein
MALTVPIGGLSFLVMTVAFCELGQLLMFPTVAFVWLHARASCVCRRPLLQPPSGVTPFVR